MVEWSITFVYAKIALYKLTFFVQYSVTPMMRLNISICHTACVLLTRNVLRESGFTSTSIRRHGTQC